MQKEFVTYELALRLKAIGFNDRVLTYFEDGNVKIYDKGTMGWDFNNSFLNCLSRPTFSQAFTWFRDKHKIYYALKPVIGSKNDYDSYPILGWDYDIFKTNIGSTNSFYMDWEVSEWFTATLDRFEEGDKLEDLVEPKLYEEAEFACLETMVRILENEKKK